MTNKHNHTPDRETDSLVSSFHQVQSLIPEGQSLLTIPPEKPVKEALQLMQQHRYSQLPVVAGNAVLGVFSYRSFSLKALTHQKRSNDWLGDRPVEEFLEELEYAHPADDWNRVMRYLDQDDAFLVGHRNGLGGLVTTMDMLTYFQSIADPFIMLAEIELSLRKIVRTCVQDADLSAFLKESLASTYDNGQAPTTLQDVTFNDYITLIASKENWPYFEKVFGARAGVRKQTSRRLEQLRRWRNTVFHYRRRLETWEKETLHEYREWLERRVRVYEARLRQRETAASLGKTNREQFLDRCSPPAAAAFFSYVLDRSQSAGHVIYWGEKGFSVRLKLEGDEKLATFSRNFPPDAFSFYHADLPLSEDEISAIRSRLLDYGFFEPAGQYSLKTNVTEGNLAGLRNAYDYILEQMAAVG
ncbi:MAG: CBS domain-containing protein [Candidatus Promineifilaceae bacterium]|nr:CBS domain-containing protein [Candidatus Promineifilaceae bacterium]